MLKEPPQATACGGLVSWPFGVLNPEEVDEGKKSEGANMAEEAEGNPEELTYCGGWHPTGGHITGGKGVNSLHCSANIDGYTILYI